MYIPTGGTAETIEWYEGMCEASKATVDINPLSTTWYCNMAQRMRDVRDVLNPPPPPEPPPFVAVKTPPADIAEGSGYEQWFEDQRKKQKSEKTFILLGLAGVVALVLLKGKR